MLLLDSNLVIYASKPEDAVATRFIAARPGIGISVITKVESLGFHSITEIEHRAISTLLSLMTVYPANDAVIDRAITFRQRKRMKLGDALIAATASVFDLTRVTRNASDFAGLPDIRVVDPYAIGET